MVVNKRRGEYGFRMLAVVVWSVLTSSALLIVVISRLRMQLW